MKKKLPNIALPDYSLKSILEIIFDQSSQKVFFNFLYEELKSPKILTKKEITIGLIVNEDLLINIPKKDYKNLVKSTISYFVNQEDYNKCDVLQKLLNQLENNG
jgi:predicted transport protein